jgi:adenylate cyclase
LFISSFIKLNLFLRIILFLVLSKGAFAQTSVDSTPIPTLKRIIIKNDSVIFSSDSSKLPDNGLTRKFVLNFRENDISFELKPENSIGYQYYLEGFDKNWSGLNHQSYIKYTNLPSGKYLLKIRYNISGKSGEEINLVSFRVLPLWYFSHLAFILYLIIFSLIIWTLYDLLNLRFARKVFALEQIINTRTEDLIVEKEKTETLLANVLPKNTASEIMEKGKATKIKYNFVTVLFSDIQGFTKIAEEMNPEILIDELDKFFFYFDSVAEKFGIEKIKTIGDSYMCAGGIPEKNRTNPVEVILAALEMKRYMTDLKEKSEIEGMKFWDIRIGIHTGTVVAGVVGQKKLSYDIWGDTVNTASRMESSGEAGKINISGTTYQFVKEFFNCEYRGKMPVKYKGELDMYFVDGIIPELSDENGSPNNKFVIKMQMIKLVDIEEIIIKMFDDEAPPNLYFHNSAMVKNISNQVELLSRAENLPDEDYINLKLASIFLLSGYISDYEKPMEASLRLVEEKLPGYGFTRENVASTKELIRNSFSDHRDSLIDNILHDARYDYLGRVDYLNLTDKLLREQTEYGKHSDKKTWIDSRIKQLTDHQFVTESARLLRSVSSEDQIAGLAD